MSGLQKEVRDCFQNSAPLQEVICQTLLPLICAAVLEDPDFGQQLIIAALDDGNVQQMIIELIKKEQIETKVCQFSNNSFCLNLQPDRD